MQLSYHCWAPQDLKRSNVANGGGCAKPPRRPSPEWDSRVPTPTSSAEVSAAQGLLMVMQPQFAVSNGVRSGDDHYGQARVRQELRTADGNVGPPRRRRRLAGSGIVAAAFASGQEDHDEEWESSFSPSQR